MKNTPFVSIFTGVRFDVVSCEYEGKASLVSISFPSRFASFLVSTPMHAKRETRLLNPLQ